MAEKLTEVTWTGFTKKMKLDLDDGPLIKALAKLDKTPETKPEARVEALDVVVDEIKKRVTALAKRKKELGDKVFGEIKDKLYALLASAEALQKDAEKAAAPSSADEDEESPALLTTKLVPLLREVRKGDLVLQALIALAGKESVVLVSRKAISPSRGKLLKEQMTNPGGLKFIRGECTFEENALTFIVQAPSGGLAKRIKAALLEQTQQRFKVRVRGEDEDAFDEDGEADGQSESAGGQAGTGGAEAAGGPPDPAHDTEAATAPRVEPAAAFNARLAALVARVKAAGPEVRAKVSEAALAARKQDFALGQSLLDEVERMLEAGPSANVRAPAGEDGMAKWKMSRTAAIASLKTVATQIAGARHASSAKAILEIQAVIKNLTAEPTTLQQVSELQRWLGTDEVVEDVCDLVEDIRTPLYDALEDLRGQLAA